MVTKMKRVPSFLSNQSPINAGTTISIAMLVTWEAHETATAISERPSRVCFTVHAKRGRAIPAILQNQ